MADFGVVLMRKDPPFDQGYLTATWILDRAATAVFNAPAGLRDINEKLGLARFADLAPATFVLREAAEIRRVLAEMGGRMILKPVFGYGGREVLLARADDPNLGSLIELATADGTAKVEQVYVTPDARDLGFGDGLLEAAIESARQDGAVAIEAEALPGDRETKNLYERAGVTARKLVVWRAL